MRASSATAKPVSCLFAFIATAVLSLPSAAFALTVIVPDQFPTVQAAVDFLPGSGDTLQIRAGAYPERVVVVSNLVLMGIPSGAMPRINGLRIDKDQENDFGLSEVHAIGIHFGGPVVHVNSTGPASFSFTSCQFDSGMSDQSLSLETTTISIHKSTLFGTTQIISYLGVVDSCVVHGPLTMNNDYGSWALGNLFENVTGVALAVRGRDPVVAGNIVRVATHGIGVLSDDNRAFVTGNTVEDCSETGIQAVAYDSLLLIGNRVVGCGGEGISGASSNAVIARANSVLGCGGSGLLLTLNDNTQIDTGLVELNVVGRCGGDGVRLVNLESFDGWEVRNNTIYGCTGNGILLPEGSATVANNIGFGNTGYGLSWAGPTAPTLSCNDWFANTAGAVNGDPGPSDLAVDPRFCDVGADDVHLLEKSPLVDAGVCGLIGAFGTGCAQTPTLVTRFDAERVAGGIQITWRVVDPEAVSAIHLERAERAAGPWNAIRSERSRRDDLVLELDRDVRDDRGYWYRLIGGEAGRPEALAAPLEVGPHATAAFALRPLSPNPASARVRVEFELARRAPITLDVFDVQGRWVASLARGLWPAGRHSVEWSGASAAGTAPPGLYLVRYRFPGGHHDARVVRTR